MDPILAAPPPSLLSCVEGQLSNDEVSSDEEMLEHFISNGLTEEQARQALTFATCTSTTSISTASRRSVKEPRRFASTHTPGSSSRNSPHPFIPSRQPTVVPLLEARDRN